MRKRVYWVWEIETQPAKPGSVDNAHYSMARPEALPAAGPGEAACAFGEDKSDYSAMVRVTDPHTGESWRFRVMTSTTVEPVKESENA